MKPILAGKTILVVEDYPPMRKAIRDMLHTLEADTIFEAENGANAISALGKNNFDIVLCDYNLGPGKNGQQILEEARYRRLLPLHAIFIIITAEQTASMVLGAMDSKPDEYLTKPFNTQQLFNRIERNLLRKSYLHRVEQELDRGNLPQAIAHCNHLLTQGDKKMRTTLLKQRAELAINIGDFATARKIYQDVLEQRDLPWARLGLAIVDFQEANIQAAISGFENLIADNPMYLESYDWLSKAYETLNKPLDAQAVLLNAVDLSPQSILRQKKLAETADRNGNNAVAEMAYKATVNLGKNSIYKSCSDFSNLAKLYSKTNSPTEALKTLQDMRQEYINSPEAELRAATLEADLHQKLGHEEMSKQAFATVMALNQQLDGKLPKDLQLDVVRSCFLNNQPQQAEVLLKDLIKANIDDDQFMDDLRRMQSNIGMKDHSEKMIQSTKRELIAINNQGVALYKQGKFQEAMELFEQAVLTLPDNKTIILNMLKIMVHDLKTNQVSIDKLVKVQSLMKKAKQIGIDNQKLGGMQLELAKLAKRKTPEVHGE
jgi:DNA-binding response OmpR family regulator/Tfp pilus assembly protein PilF